jgi:hypothetical protein
MKFILPAFVTLFITTSLVAEPLRLSEPVATNATSETFGIVLNTDLPMVSLSTLAEESKEYVGKSFQLETKISKVCQKKGCFFIAQQNEHIIRVSFKDYSFFVPTDSSGKTVILAGQLIQKEMTQKQAEHFNADLQSNSDSIKPGVVYEIVANSVQIPLT